MVRMSGNDKYPSGNFGDSLQQTNWVLDSGVTCHMTPKVWDFIPGLLEDTDNYIEVEDGHHVMEKQKGQVQIKMCYNNGYPFIANLHNILLAQLPLSLKRTCFCHFSFYFGGFRMFEIR